MSNTKHPNCLNHQSACGRTVGEPICLMCGMDERVCYVSGEAGLLAANKAEARHGQSHAKAPQMAVLPSGSFLMGSADDDAFGSQNERPQHNVTIAYKLAMGRYPVTFEEWDACVAEGGIAHKPGDEGWGRGTRPVINVSWEDAQAYAAWLNNKLGIAATDPTRYRLPSEAEWEYACRASTTGNFSTPTGQLSDNDATYYAGFVDANVSPKAGKKHDKTTPIGIYAPNPWGLYDMHGNVYEWMQDDYEDSYRGVPADGSALTTSAAKRVLRGGSWLGLARNSRAAERLCHSPDGRGYDIGFRLARTAL
jgi:formylglycine-generating enzyme required for sulfatase activity